MKMTGKYSPEFACGQILFSIKESQLNYVVNETPYSVHVTLRKTFIKEAVEKPNTTSTNVLEESSIAVRKKLQQVEKENIDLKKKINEKDKDIGMIQFENEEFELKNEKLETEIVDLNFVPKANPG